MSESVWRISKDEATGEQGMVVARDPHAARVGLDVLRRGGNAVDAAVTMAFTLGVVEPGSSGIGGGGMMVVHETAKGRSTVVDYAMDAPLAAGPDTFELADGKGVSSFGWRKVKDEANILGHRSASIPGAVRGLALALERFGTLSLGETLAPAIRFAEEGVDVDVTLAWGTAMTMPVLTRFPATAAIFLPRGYPLRNGGGFGPTDRLVQRDLGQTLRRIAAVGPNAFYQGELAQRIAGHVQENGGLISEEDLARYQPTVYDGGQVTTYRGHQIVGVPGACGSITAQQGLNILEGFDLPPSGTVERLHLQAEAFRLAFADRYCWMGDPKQPHVPRRGLLSKEYAEERRAEIDPTRAAVAVGPGSPHRFDGTTPSSRAAAAVPAPIGGSTTHLSVVDKGRNVVSLTQTLVNHFGSGVVVPGTGVLLIIAMSWFDPEPDRVNSLAPGKRGLNNMSPLVVLRDGRPIMAVGAAGGRKIIHAVAQIVGNVIDDGMGIQHAIAAPRLDCSGMYVLANARLPETLIAGLRELGHRVEVAEEGFFRYPFSTALGVLVDHETGTLHGGVDPYQVAFAAGY
ncbi:MAG: gamma-glutamyltranspeptidase / glutathione hydrolase [Thermomicrobiales bacterium]|nr:gamma-glutamyltranspeptidase / glutathione hydrolase [Thermomicrobiales bacterium]